MHDTDLRDATTVEHHVVRCGNDDVHGDDDLPAHRHATSLSNLDPCKLVVEADFQSRGFGPLSGTPTPYPEIPGSCGCIFGKGAPDDLVVITGVLDTGYESEKAKNPGGHEGLIEGHTTY
ncbi:hypothetical protein, partial [Lentzea roselyniae]|uniref:hypothetical protein n=1 Tax=Lentzea roselyniae TaxID=531940 RepID=UPI0031F7EB26